MQTPPPPPPPPPKQQKDALNMRLGLNPLKQKQSNPAKLKESVVQVCEQPDAGKGLSGSGSRSLGFRV